MQILVHTENNDRWIEPLRNALPHHSFVDHREPHDVHQIEMAVVGWFEPGALHRYVGLRLVQSTWMGVDRLLVEGCLPTNTTIARMVDPAMPISMSETVLAHTIYAHRQLDIYARQASRKDWIEREQPLAPATTVGILGMGELGRACARTLRTVGFPVVGWSRQGNPVPDVEVTTDLEHVLSSAAAVVNLLPLTDSTRGLLCTHTFNQMRKGAVLINVGRGAHVVDNDLLAALDNDQLRHAFLDVFRSEPLAKDHPFWVHDRITVTPHIAADSNPATCLPVIVNNIERLSRGEQPMYLVDRSVGY
jgi:glyoxylate/hydroxypyruvate reductase